VQCAQLEFGISLDSVEQVLMQPETQPLAGGPPFLCEYFEFAGSPMCVLDMPRRLGVEHARPPLERKLIVVRSAGQRLALCVDEVREPELFSRDRVVSAESVGGTAHPPLQGALLGFVPAPRGPTPVIDPAALFSAERLAELTRALQAGTSAA
jgi:chemotaxis signal transduction protein